ncbi:MAG: MarC family protein, partial [Gemmatimonadaceae bacterium]
MSITSAALLLFLVMDPLGNIPFFLASLRAVPAHRHSRVVLRELLIAYVVMIAFLFLGRPLIGVLGISEPALTLAGGVILFLIAL